MNKTLKHKSNRARHFLLVEKCVCVANLAGPDDTELISAIEVLVNGESGSVETLSTMPSTHAGKQFLQIAKVACLQRSVDVALGVEVAGTQTEVEEL